MEWTEEKLKSWIKTKNNWQKVVEKMCNECEFTETKIALFMAGSPGAGKTETAKRLIESLPRTSFVHIDQDLIKSLLPEYIGNNAERYHGAASIGVEKVLDHVLSKGCNFVLDSTLSDFKKARNNIERSLKKGCTVKIYFVYQDPKHAWSFVKKREQVEGRVVPKDSFVNQFVESRKVVNEIKNIFDTKVKLHFVSKTVNKDGVMREKFEFNVKSVDNYIKKMYGKIYINKEEILHIL